MLGISIYPEKEELKKTLDYIDLASKYNFKRVFTCLLSVTGSKQEIKEQFSTIIKYARNKGMEVILDIAPSIFDKLDISYNDLSFFNEIGASGIRLDESFDGVKEGELTENKFGLDIEINMSANNPKNLHNVLKYVKNKNKLIGCHNFYPMEFSGLSLECFTNTSTHFKKHQIRTAAFVSSQSANHGPWLIMDKGLCTLEMHRNLPITTQVKHLLMMGLTDDIIIGNAFASKEELKAISEINVNYPVFDVEVSANILDVEKEIVFESTHTYRGDFSDYLIRSTESRIKYKNSNFIQHDTELNCQKGSVYICNNNFAHYKGELHLIKVDHPNNLIRKNLVAKIVPHEIFLLDYLKPWSKFAFNEAKK